MAAGDGRCVFCARTRSMNRRLNWSMVSSLENSMTHSFRLVLDCLRSLMSMELP